MPISDGVSIPNPAPRAIEEYRGRTDPEAVKAVAQEMEAMFAYELLKAMRAASGTAMKGGLGGNTYTSLFDMELSKTIAKRGLGLQDMLLHGIKQQAASTKTGQDASGITEQEKIPEVDQGTENNSGQDIGRHDSIGK